MNNFQILNPHLFHQCDLLLVFLIGLRHPRLKTLSLLIKFIADLGLIKDQALILIPGKYRIFYSLEKKCLILPKPVKTRNCKRFFREYILQFAL